MDFSGILPLFGVFLRILAGTMFAEAILTAVSFRVIQFLQLAWTVCDGSFDNHFASAQLLILHSAMAYR